MNAKAIAFSAVALASIPFIADSAEASTTKTGIVQAMSLNVRSQPSTSSTILGSLPRNSSVSITGEQGNWYQIVHNNRTAFVHKSYITLQNTAVPSKSNQYMVNATSLNVRTGPSTGASIIGSLINGKLVEVLSEENGWYKISYNTQTAYVKKEFLSVVSGSEVKGITDPGEVKAITPSPYYVTVSGLRVRTGPGTSYAIQSVLGNAQKVTVVGEVNGWYKITYGNAVGFVSKNYVQPAGSSAIQTSAFIFPASAGYVSSKFGMRWGSMHYGVDLAASGNVQIFAAADGKVSRSYYSSSYGNVVFVKHTINGQLYTTVYAHLKSRSVKEGDTVKSGQILGYMGNTGNSFGQHLHFELHKGEWNISKTNAIDPLPYIQR
ncbi:SH3 domain-containing protein [Ectobacillus sp. JY-23]|uniref:SH3 domain-containing protein n=1 Tax=Ectobacillus sp. JY-23 TaxID=2933872 RepID=UPI001FF6912E|nr:SH3 domain-containing protein [Ectobacillus sp. JY-23]UOY91971.1 SH3 domain-containing protein [Ectobacillus sp. JY-23]